MSKIENIVKKKKFISLTTFKKDDSRVATPIWFIWKDKKLLMFSEENTWKLKRIRNNPNVELIPCSYLGNPKGDLIIEGTAKFLDNEYGQEILRLMKKKYPFMCRIVVNTKKKYKFFEVTPIKIKKRD